MRVLKLYFLPVKFPRVWCMVFSKIPQCWVIYLTYSMSRRCQNAIKLPYMDAICVNKESLYSKIGLLLQSISNTQVKTNHGSPHIHFLHNIVKLQYTKLWLGGGGTCYLGSFYLKLYCYQYYHGMYYQIFFDIFNIIFQVK